MKILFSWQRANLSSWEPRDFSPGVLLGPRATDNHDRHEGEVGLEPIPEGAYDRVGNAIMEYRIFPPRMAERIVSRTPIQIGDVVGLRYYFLPGIHLFIASRVIEVFDEIKEGIARKGFTYRTLEGHVELGEETFAVEKDLATGRVIAFLQAWSRPGHWLTRLGYWYARWCQLHAGRSAIRYLQEIAKTDSSKP
jgi:uncharacterized protein (UPF0548 family)